MIQLSSVLKVGSSCGKLVWCLCRHQPTLNKHQVMKRMAVKLTPVRRSVFFENMAWLIDGEQFKNVKARLSMFPFFFLFVVMPRYSVTSKCTYLKSGKVCVCVTGTRRSLWNADCTVYNDTVRFCPTVTRSLFFNTDDLQRFL